MYGHQARIGYTSPPMVTEVFPREFYNVAPEGVTLAFTTLAVLEVKSDEIDQSLALSLRAAKEMAHAGVDAIVLGGAPVNASVGLDNVDDLMRRTSDECGVPVTTSLTAQMRALDAVGARKVALVSPGNRSAVSEHMVREGCEVLDERGADYPFIQVGAIPSEVPAQLAREAVRDHPETDTVFFKCAHWATLDQIQKLEDELNINVLSASQAIIWHAMRLVGVTDSIPGFGRLLSQH
jgi:maleate isomerase